MKQILRQRRAGGWRDEAPRENQEVGEREMAGHEPRRHGDEDIAVQGVLRSLRRS